MRDLRPLLLLGIVLAVAPDTGAQWLKLPTAGLPRLPDGTPDLTAPVPRTTGGKPDLSGIWRNDGGDRLYNNVTVDMRPEDVAPWADAPYVQRKLAFGKDSMETKCLPLGPALTTTKYRMARIVQTPTLVMFAYDDQTHREIFMDGRTLEAEPNPTWMGYSVGRWDGDVLVVESNGYTDRSWLDFDGHPHTEQLRITERYTRKNVGQMEVQVAMTDPKVYARPITFTMPMKLQADTELLESVCENNTSLARMTKLVPAKPVEVPAATLAGHVGVYDLVDADRNKTAAAFTLSGATLWLDYDGKGKEPLIPLSSTRFSWSGTIVEFPAPGNVVFHYAEGSESGPRRK